MFTLKCRLFGHVYEVEAETKEEILSLAIAGFEQNAELISISEDGVGKYEHCEIYALIGKVAY